MNSTTRMNWKHKSLARRQNAIQFSNGNQWLGIINGNLSWSASTKYHEIQCTLFIKLWVMRHQHWIGMWVDAIFQSIEDLTFLSVSSGTILALTMHTYRFPMLQLFVHYSSVPRLSLLMLVKKVWCQHSFRSQTVLNIACVLWLLKNMVTAALCPYLICHTYRWVCFYKLGRTKPYNH